MPKPLIGLTTTQTPQPSYPPIIGTNRPYADAVTAAGGIPMLIPNDLADDDLDMLLHRLDGILFTGGYDVDPTRYGHAPHPKVVGIDAERDRVEIHLVQRLVESGKPFFGICRGLQVINVALGGSLYEHLPEQLPGNVHSENHARPRDFLAHSIEVVPGSRLAEILDCRSTPVNSLHHQGVRRLSGSLQATATAPDGLVEALELPGRPFSLAVQWHPEELQDYVAMRRLFHNFVQACQVKERV
jgi:putative glutamine amidotransferase